MTIRFTKITFIFVIFFIFIEKASAILPLTFTAVPAVPQVMNQNSEKTLQYTIQNNTRAKLWPLLFSDTVTAGTMQPVGGCGTELASSQSCTESFLYTSPSIAQTVQGSVTVNYGGRFNLTDRTLTIDVATPTISVTEPSLMFVNKSFGRLSRYTGTLTVTNTGAVTVHNLVAIISNNTGSIITQSSTTCTDSLNINATCRYTFTSAVPVDANALIAIHIENGNTVTIPVAAISVVALAPPVDTTVGLTLVTGCANTTQDAGLLEITNNSNATVNNILATSNISGVTISNPSFTSGTNIYCNGNTLAKNQYCEIRVASGLAIAGATGVVTFAGTGTQPVSIATKIEAPAIVFPYVFNTANNGGILFVANHACNLVEVVTPNNAPLGANPTWFAGNTYCAGMINNYSDWRIPDVGETPGSSGAVISGEWNALYNGGTPLAGLTLSPMLSYWGPSVNTAHAWSASPFKGTQTQLNYMMPNVRVRCVRAFTV